MFCITIFVDTFRHVIERPKKISRENESAFRVNLAALQWIIFTCLLLLLIIALGNYHPQQQNRYTNDECVMLTLSNINEELTLFGTK